MKNKLLKILACFAGISAVGSTITVATTSCSCSSKQEEKALPLQVYEYDQDDPTILTGFKDEFLNVSTSPIYWKKFQDCNTMEIPSNVATIANDAFSTYFDELSSLIPSFIKKIIFKEESNLSLIGNTAFGGCSSVDYIDFSNCSHLTTIGANAFEGCSLISSVDFSNCLNLSSIGYCAFRFCPSIKDIKIDNDYYHVLKLGENGKVVVPKNQTSWTDTSEVIGSLACGDIEIPSSISTIVADSFKWCSSITSVSFPKGLTQIGDLAFQGCSSITSVDLSNCSSLSMIGFAAFQCCSSIRDIKISENNANYHILQLGSGKVVVPKAQTSWTDTSEPEGSLICGDIKLPANITTISHFGFYSCWSITSVDLSDCLNLTELNGSFSYCKSIASITFSSNLTTIDNSAFLECSSLSFITWNGLSSAPTNINDDAFSFVSKIGKVKSTGSYSSKELLDFLKTKGLPDKWEEWKD